MKTFTNPPPFQPSPIDLKSTVSECNRHTGYGACYLVASVSARQNRTWADGFCQNGCGPGGRTAVRDRATGRDRISVRSSMPACGV